MFAFLTFNEKMSYLGLEGKIKSLAQTKLKCCLYPDIYLFTIFFIFIIPLSNILHTYDI